MITIALAVDEDVRWNVIVPESDEKSLTLFRLRIASGVSLVSEGMLDLAMEPDRVQTIDLVKGVYLINTAMGLRFEVLKQVRVHLAGGKDPWPPPPAPQGTDLAMFRDVYERGFNDAVISAGGESSRWVEIKPLKPPMVATPVEGKHV